MVQLIHPGHLVVTQPLAKVGTIQRFFQRIEPGSVVQLGKKIGHDLLEDQEICLELSGLGLSLGGLGIGDPELVDAVHVGELALY